jgi:hypothetical protein
VRSNKHAASAVVALLGVVKNAGVMLAAPLIVLPASAVIVIPNTLVFSLLNRICVPTGASASIGNATSHNPAA